MRTARGYLRVLQGGLAPKDAPAPDLEIPLDVDTGPFELRCPSNVRLLGVTSRWFLCFTRAPWPGGAPEVPTSRLSAARPIYPPGSRPGRLLSRYRIWYPPADAREREGHEWRSMRRR